MKPFFNEDCILYKCSGTITYFFRGVLSSIVGEHVVSSFVSSSICTGFVVAVDVACSSIFCCSCSVFLFLRGVLELNYR